jgi:hypothetical protein
MVTVTLSAHLLHKHVKRKMLKSAFHMLLCMSVILRLPPQRKITTWSVFVSRTPRRVFGRKKEEEQKYGETAYGGASQFVLFTICYQSSKPRRKDGRRM